MKKMMIAMLSALAVGSAFCGVRYSECWGAEDVKASIAAVESFTNNADSHREFFERRLHFAMYTRKYDQLFLELDEKLAKRGLGLEWGYCTISNTPLPKTSAIALDAAIRDGRFMTNAFEVAKKYGCSATIYTLLSCKSITLGDCAMVLSDYLDEKGGARQSRFEIVEGIVKKIQGLSVLAVKRHLRSIGKSFVTRNGVNPCEDYIVALNKAVNAPRFEGLNEWLASVGVSERVDTSRLPSVEDVGKLKKSILDLSIDPSNKELFILRICLGVDEYNAFVKEYNGD